ncbi:hypothetical protein [Nocardioides sp.]|uniref:hypothetical protein n=1 Tax=Nocardioides sp. TaxID=35761 RepID=UPI0039E3F810
MSTEAGSHARWLLGRAVEAIERTRKGPQEPLAHLLDLRHARDHLHDSIGYMVVAAVREGASYAQVGRALRISRQAARQAHLRRLVDAEARYQRAHIDRDLPPLPPPRRRIRWPWLRRAA